MQHRIAFPLAALFLLAACGEQDPVSTLSANPSAGGANPIVLSARGSGQVELPLPLGDQSQAGLRTFSFTGEERADGSVRGSGQYKQHNTNGDDILQHGELVCMADLGGGWVGMGFRSTKRIAPSDPTNPLGLAQPGEGDHGFVLAVKDNGEGNNAAPDRITGAVHTTMFYVGLICSDDNSAYAQPPHLGLNLLVKYDPTKSVDVVAGNVQTTGTE